MCVVKLQRVRGIIFSVLRRCSVVTSYTTSTGAQESPSDHRGRLLFQIKLPYQWQPKIVSTQVAVIGKVVIAGVPGEFTTMSGRRLREAIKEVTSDVSNEETSVIVAGLCNTYSDYITTPEEYQVKTREFYCH